MIDSVLKGTGNSRFLKSAVPAGTSWADALAMLQAGTFPIDFNGINTEGFQQVGTSLNKANLLKDATAAQISLPPSTTPDGMFQALGNTGELHVWRKTVVYNQPVPEVPGSYTLGTAQSLHIATRTSSNSDRTSNITGVLASNEVTVDISGEVSLKDPATITLYPQASRTDTRSGLLSGYSYFMFPSSTVSSNNCAVAAPTDKIYYVASNVEFKGFGTYTYGETAVISAAQLVTGVPGTPAIPAGTTTTYPVSTNPNAYQEGDDAKAAGYVVGEVVTGSFRVSYATNSTGALYGYCDSVTVDDNGVIHGKDVSTTYVNASSSDSLTTANSFKGKFIYLSNAYGITGIPFVQGTLYYIPTDAVFTRINGNEVLVDRYQPVTGYAAIPAGTTIEYLGKLGDKARVQVVSYVGTGTYGSSNPNSLTFDFVAKFIMELGSSSGKEGIYFPGEGGVATIPNFLDNDYRSRCGFGDLTYSWCKKSTDGKTITWYSTRDQYKQENSAGVTYYYVAIG